MAVERKHYLVTGALRASYDAWNAADEAKRQEWNAWAESYGVETIVINSGLGCLQIDGLMIVKGKEPPAGFRVYRARHGGPDWWGPALKTKEGREIQQTLNRLARNNPTLPGFSHVLAGNKFCTEGWELLGNDLIVSIPQPTEYVPPDSRYLKMSEYYALREAADAVAATNASAE